ncbi:PulJ/GspJ family protein [Arcobacter sp.]|uniref:PulJ/GspJ family protein n=1 Tax=unclassified Arcobacter TaxID=2593671 RepID=UPI003B00683A
MKKAFTLIEILISITLFSLILVFLYKSLDLTKQSNFFYEKKLNTLESSNRLKSILYEDIAKAKNIEITFDRSSNTILKIQTKDMYHNPFYKYVTYIISQDKNLLRIESLYKFNEREVLDSFFNDAFVDKLDSDILKFKVSQSKENKKIYSILLEKKDKPIVFFNTLTIN